MTDTVQPGLLQAGAIPCHYVDNAELPKWGKADDGSNVKLVPDVLLHTDFAAWSSEACQHKSQFTGKTTNSIGADVYKRYCKECGIATTQHLGHRTIAGTAVTVIDNAKREKLVDKYVRHRRDGLDEIANRCANRTQPSRRAEYADYLSSPQWQAIRAAVMERCDGICEGCRQRSAEDVHHLSYRHNRQEFLFELVGLCRPCHERWHEDDA